MAYAYFDVWRYEGDPLRREFIRDVASQLKDAKVLRRDFDIDRHIERLDSDVSEIRRSRLTFDRQSLFRGALFALAATLVVLAVLWLGPKLGLSTDRHAIGIRFDRRDL